MLPYFLKLLGYILVLPQVLYVSNPDDLSKSFKLEKVMALDFKSGQNLVPVNTIPTRDVINSTPGLKNMLWPEQPRAFLLLGMDYAHFFKGPPVQNTPEDTHVLKTILGISVAGNLGTPESIATFQNQHNILSVNSEIPQQATVGIHCSYLGSCFRKNYNDFISLEMRTHKNIPLPTANIPDRLHMPKTQ